MTSSSDVKQPAASGGIASMIFLVLHLLLGVALLVVLMGMVPRYQKVFEDFDVELPVITQGVIHLSRAAVSYWYLFVVMGAAVLALDYFVLQTLRRNSGRVVQILWGVLWLLVPFAIAAFVFVALTVPLLRLTESLQ